MLIKMLGILIVREDRGLKSSFIIMGENKDFNYKMHLFLDGIKEYNDYITSNEYSEDTFRKAVWADCIYLKDLFTMLPSEVNIKNILLEICELCDNYIRLVNSKSVILELKEMKSTCVSFIDTKIE